MTSRQGAARRAGDTRRDTNSSRDPRDGLALRNLMEAMRYEVARELGGPGAAEGQFGDWTTAQSGRFGAILYKRAKALLESQGEIPASAKYVGARHDESDSGEAEDSADERPAPKNERDRPKGPAPKNRRPPKNGHKRSPYAK